MASIFINPKTDFAFKKIFGSEQSHGILVSFLNGILYAGESLIEDLEILNPYQAPRIRGVKDTYLDVKARLTRANLNRDELEELEHQSIFIQDQRNAVSLANKQGREEGREEGALSMQKTIAMNLLSSMDNTAIAQMTGLSIAEVEALQ
jgi:hypothetical protein